MVTPSPEIKRFPPVLYGIDKAVRQRGMHPDEKAWDDYLIPKTNTLRNKLGRETHSYGIANAQELKVAEEKRSFFRMAQLQQNPLAGDFDLTHMQAIHRHLLQDVYTWAGEPRTVPLFKQNHQYAPHQEITQRWAKQHEKLAQEGFLAGITDQEAFTERLAYHWATVNHTHAFREGNTRSQCLFFKDLARQAGWELDISRLDPEHQHSLRDPFVTARFQHQAGATHRPLATVLNQIVSPSPEKTHQHNLLLESRQQRFPELYDDTPSTPDIRQNLHDSFEP